MINGLIMYAEKDIRLNGNKSFEFNSLAKKPANAKCKLISNRYVFKTND